MVGDLDSHCKLWDFNLITTSLEKIVQEIKIDKNIL